MNRARSEGKMTSPGGTDPKRGDSEARPATRPRVLLADDYANILTAMVRLISSSCDVVGTVTTGAQLLDAARRLDPDVIVVDLNLPDMSGLDACRQLKAAAPRGSVILLTAERPQGQAGRVRIGCVGLHPEVSSRRRAPAGDRKGVRRPRARRLIRYTPCPLSCATEARSARPNPRGAPVSGPDERRGWPEPRRPPGTRRR